MCIFNKDKDELPESGVRVLIKVLREGVVLTTFGYHAGKREVEVSEEFSEFADYDEGTGTAYDLPGWYETSIYGDYYYNIEDEVVGWTPLPKIARELM